MGLKLTFIQPLGKMFLLNDKKVVGFLAVGKNRRVQPLPIFI